MQQRLHALSSAVSSEDSATVRLWHGVDLYKLEAELRAA